jgi:Fibronectin type III domain/PQQ-like domain
VETLPEREIFVAIFAADERGRLPRGRIRVKRILGSWIRPRFYWAAWLAVCCTLISMGCNSGSATPPPDTKPPSTPAGLTASVISAVQINLAWTASTDNIGVTGYKVERCQGAGCSNFAQVGTPSSTSFSDTGLTGSTSYLYRVRATDAAGNLSSYSTTSSASTSAPTLTAPTNLTATAMSATQINLSWTGSTETGGTISNYLVERCAPAGCSNFAQIGMPTGTSFNDTGLTGSTSYSYRVRATDAAGNLSFYSTTSSASTSAPTLTAPTNLTATAMSVTQINLSWTASTETGGTINNYLVERCAGTGCSNFAQVATPAGTSFNDAGLTASTSYSYRVRATDAASHFSNYSSIASATTPGVGNISVTITPRRGGITASQTQAFTATVTNDLGNAGVTWSTTGGTLTGQTATAATFSSSSAGSFTITATSNADNTKSSSATIGVTDLVGVLTYHNNLARDGTNTKEYALTPSNVTAGSFGRLFSCAVDGEVYAQPLWVPNLAIGGGSHNVVFVATQNDSVYAFDADTSPCHQYWQKNFLASGITPVPPGDTGETGDINKKIGITSTPVIDPASKTLYVLAKTKEGTANYHQRLHALSLIDGTEKFGGPVDITSAVTVPGGGDTGDSSVGCTSTSGNVPFCPLRENQRAGLALANGVVYVAWASHGDNQPYHGWIMGFNASTLARVSLFNDSPNGRESGIWMSGGAPAFDSANNLYVITGNGDYDGTNDFGDSFLKLSSTLALQDWFTPFVQSTLDALDLDLGSGGAVVLVDLASSAVPHILIGGGKGTNQLGQMYVINRDPGMMGQNANPDKSVQQFNLNGMIYSTAAFWQNTMYIAAVGQPLSAYALNTSTSMFNTVATSQSPHSYGFPGVTPSVSSQGTTNGIVWALDTNSTTAGNGSGTDGPAVLYAYDALNLATQLYSSDSTIGAANAAGNAVKFCVPVVANGKVYVGTQTELTVFGLLP